MKEMKRNEQNEEEMFINVITQFKINNKVYGFQNC